MNKAELLKKYAREERDHTLFAQVLDKYTAAQQSDKIISTPFVSQRQGALVERMLQEARSSGHVFFGGYEGAERNIILFLPEWAEVSDAAEYAPLHYIRAVWSDKVQAEIGHRDFLGALMAAGIRRETVGDILPGAQSCDFIVLSGVAPYLMQEFTSAGRASLTLQEITPAQLQIPEKEVKQIRDTVASLRLDNILGSGFGLSRDKASALIHTGKVLVDGLECVKPDKQLSGGETVSARGFGKFRLLRETTKTKKGRIGIFIEKYI